MRLIVPLVTPLAEEDKLDRAALERLIEHVISGGVEGIFVLGTTGEGPSLSGRLRREMIRETCRLTGSRVPVMAGIIDTSFSESLTLAGFASEHGVVSCAFAPPYYFTYSQDQLLAYIERLAAASPLPLLLYNIPRLTKVAFSVETVKRSTEIRGITGIKDSSGDLDYLAAVIAATRHAAGFEVFVGPEEILLEGIKLGAHGGVCGGANLAPALFACFIASARAADWHRAAELQSQILANSQALYTIGDPDSSYMRGIKAALDASGFCSDLLAPPLCRFSPLELDELKRRLARLPLPAVHHNTSANFAG